MSMITIFLLILGSLFLLVIGYFAGISHPPLEQYTSLANDPYRVQWETLLAGFAAIVGGVLAYRAAYVPQKMRTRIASIRVRNELNDIKTKTFILFDTAQNASSSSNIQKYIKEEGISEEEFKEKMVNENKEIIDNGMTDLSDFLNRIESEDDILSEELIKLIKNCRIRSELSIKTNGKSYYFHVNQTKNMVDNILELLNKN